MYINFNPLIEELKPRKTKEKKALGILKNGGNLETENYIKSIKKQAKELGVKTIVQDLANTYGPYKLVEDISDFIIPVKPFPELLEKIIKLDMDPFKDVDNFSCKNYYDNCTAEAVLKILKYLNINIDKHVLVIGRHIGLEIFKLLLDHDYTVGLAHSKTKNLELLTKNVDVIITATGVKELIKKEMVKVNSLVIDIGLGDVEKEVADKADVTPSINGVGAITTACLFKHILGNERKEKNEGLFK